MNPRWQIETSRLVLRLPQPEDVRALQQAVQITLPDLAQWLPPALKGQTQAQTRNYIYTQMALFVQDENLTFGLFGKEALSDDAPGLRSGPPCLGLLELGIRVPRLPSWELSFWTRSDVAGQGLMTEAVTAALTFAFDNLKAARVFMRCEAGNTGAQRVAEKCGLHHEGCLRHDALGVDGQPVDTLVYGAIALPATATTTTT